MRLKSHSQRGNNTLFVYRGENFDLPLTNNLSDAVGINTLYHAFNKFSTNESLKDFLDIQSSENPFKRDMTVKLSKDLIILARKLSVLYYLRDTTGNGIFENHNKNFPSYSLETLCARSFFVRNPVFTVNGCVSMTDHGKISFEDMGYDSEQARAELDMVFGVQDHERTKKHKMKWAECNIDSHKNIVKHPAISNEDILKAIIQNKGKKVDGKLILDFDAKIGNGGCFFSYIQLDIIQD